MTDAYVRLILNTLRKEGMTSIIDFLAAAPLPAR
jgi:hypothetical protein